MKIWTSQHTFDHPWESVVNAQFQKYPNPFLTDVLAIDVVNRSIDTNGILKSQRILSSKFFFTIPSILQKIVPMNQTVQYAVENSEVNIKEKTCTMRSQNITFDSILSMDEIMVYSPHPTDKSKTILKKEITLEGPLSSFVKNEVTKVVTKNTEKGKEAMNWVIDLNKKGCTDLRKEFQKRVDSVILPCPSN
ncbi:hypothetical protein LOTGIDRAFT_204146 [Lottia gigantea]|uniref:PRELI/MSF1 domain-containing protein n=1 Tax=Lottia gigantea TaxID=225164 RepID=V3ZII9_LOTGI|nr:hypothetical protein LOTGIDRAFT_204146 [Lottia gigantea]ESO91098.1 hypothetical protein LOTGIDRAFT_204146 [Lottia gigantea]